MDLPIILEVGEMVYDLDEKNQQIYTCLKQKFGTILHDTKQGNNIPLHVNDNSMVEDSVLYSLSNISDIIVNSVQVSESLIKIDYIFQGKEQLYVVDTEDLL